MGFPKERSMIMQVQKEFKNFNKNLMHNDLMLHTPHTDEINNCCSTRALKCFVKSLPQLPVPSSGAKVKATFIKNLQKKIIENSVRTCSAVDTQNAVCRKCESYPERSSKEFMDSLETLLQMTLERLS
ncbi:interleukin-21 isoform X2 [Brienomyrus brachyistius]|nr:interleukin-21 isoform X2 [Brienomyrus brachyistius]XP_048852501.1 interleukin-21 isoform X2 [Brienomyrus brachyistius]